MIKILDQQLMRYLNLFGKISRIRVKDCFIYNNKIVFAVPKRQLSCAIGIKGKNIKKANELLPKRIKVVALPRNISEAGKFISAIIYPIEFKNLEIRNEEFIISTSGIKNKAELIGRNKIRLKELQNIIKQYFNKNLRII